MLPAAAIFGAPAGGSPFYVSGGETGSATGCTRLSSVGESCRSSPGSFLSSGSPISEQRLCAEGLLRDRLPEFRQTARARGSLLAPGANTGLKRSLTPRGSRADVAKAGKAGFMREFFDSISEIQNTIQKGRNNVKLMEQALEDSLVATQQDHQAGVSARLQGLVQDTNQHIAEAKGGLESLKAWSEEEAERKPNSAESRIRTNMLQAMAKKHQQLLLDFQQAQVNYKKVLQQRQYRELEILVPQATEEQRARMIEDGETAAVVVARAMAGTHAMLHDELNRITEKHQDILKLEASIAELAQMFQEMAVLVEEQGEMLDAIELNVHSTQVHTAKATKELIVTRKLQNQHTKWICCSSLCLLVLALVIMGPVLLNS